MRLRLQIGKIIGLEPKIDFKLTLRNLIKKSILLVLLLLKARLLEKVGLYLQRNLFPLFIKILQMYDEKRVRFK